MSTKYSKTGKVTVLAASFILASGCNGAVAEEQSPGLAAGSAASTPRTYDELHARDPELYPTRVSRAIFDQKVEGKVTLRPIGSDPVELPSRVAWVEYPTTLPAPEVEPLADFRDYQACAAFEELGEASLCFDVAPDVSTLDLSARKMRPTGVQALLAAHSGCSVTVQNLQFVDAKKVDRGFDVYFIASAQTDSSCPIPSGPVALDMSIREL
ncbi:MAG: hypothetical protein A2X94_13950 [Bdellovibrionales bacterium GWB1_55_8]|nr:MAG: hypothetical protein A2X94_13950 [Bdellovibrionales bacterium GWB1_55_8]